MRTRSLKVIDIAIITPEKSIRESARQMRVEHVGSLVVVDQDGKPIGMLTDRDITIEGVARGVDVDQTTVRDLMTAPVVTATESEGMVTALARMREFGIRRLPIIDSEGKLVGVVTNSNLIKELSELLDGLVRNISSSKTREVALRSDI
jgi:CBS domain-containing protein